MDEGVGAVSERERFEAWVIAPPRERSIRRLGVDSAWPGCYADYAVHFAWDAWQARAAVPPPVAQEPDKLPPLPCPYTAQVMCGEDVALYTADQMHAHAAAVAAATHPAVQVDPAWVRNGIADFVADNWPDRKHTLAEIEAGIRAIEINPPPSLYAAPAVAQEARDAALDPLSEEMFRWKVLEHADNLSSERGMDDGSMLWGFREDALQEFVDAIRKERP